MDSGLLLLLGGLIVLGIVPPVLAFVDIARKPAADFLSVGPSKAAIALVVLLTGGVGAAWWFLIARKRMATALRSGSARQ